MTAPELNIPRSLSLFCGALLIIAAIAVFWWLLFSHFVTAATPQEIALRYGLWGPEIKPEPVENYTFLVASFCAVLVIGMAAYLSVSEGGKKWLPRTPLMLDVCVVAAAGAALWFWQMDWASIVPPSPNALLSAIRKYPRGFIAGFVCLAVVLFRAGWWSGRLGWRFSAPVAAVLPLAWLSRLVITSTNDASVNYPHYEIFAYPLIQDWLGRGIYLNQQSEYGLYPIFLRPLWLLLGQPTTTAISVVMATLLLFANIAFVAFMFRFNRHKGLAVAFALLGIIFMLMFYQFWPGDSYFQFFPLRLVFPSLACIFMCFRATSTRHPFLAHAALSFGWFWNLESGLIAVAMFSVFAVFIGFRAQLRTFGQLVLKHLGMAAAAFLAALLVISGYYLLRFGTIPHWGEMFRYVRIMSAGVLAEPMPMWGAWIVHVVIYLGAIFVGLRSMFDPAAESERERYAALMAMATMGMLFLRYYQGRSMPLQLIFVSMPAVLCLGFLVDIGLSCFKKTTENIARILAVGIAAPLLSALFLYLNNSPVPNRDWRFIFHKTGRNNLDSAVDRIQEDFTRVRRRKTDEIMVVAPYAHLFQLRIGKPNPLPAAAMCLVWFQSELDAVAAALERRNTRMAVFDSNSICSVGGIRSEPRIARVLESEFQPFESGGCSVSGSQDLHTFVRRRSTVDREDLALGNRAPQISDVDLALGKRASQSSDFGGAPAAAAVDGNTDGRWETHSLTHTGLNRNAWWEVDLGASTAIGSVAVWNRTDFGSDRLKDYWLFISDAPFAPSETPTSLRGRVGTWSHYEADFPCPYTRVEVAGARGRYVRVQLGGENFLSLAEVQVFALENRTK